MEFTIYTDGGCSGNKRDSGCVGGYGFIILDPENKILIEGGGREINTTNNMMEMVAVIKGLQILKGILNVSYGGSVIHDCAVITDSKYVCENWEDYLPDWKKNNWRKANKKPVLNVRYWKEIDKLTPEFKSFRFKWVKGHNANALNERADAIAQGYIRSSQPQKHT